MLKAANCTGTTTKMAEACKVNFKSGGISILTICDVTSLSHFSRQALYLGGVDSTQVRGSRGEYDNAIQHFAMFLPLEEHLLKYQRELEA
ncbi:hypothetical protein TNCV_1152711 [Trichonephila clavipes]|nr:hypothetical protein TNCV_1152711 [Trichonephila clavipes]